MSAITGSMLAKLFEGEGFLDEWVAAQAEALGDPKVSEGDLRAESSAFLGALQDAAATGITDAHSPAWASARSYLSDLSRRRVARGFSPSETAVFVFSIRKPLFTALEGATDDPAELRAGMLEASRLVDQLGLWTIEEYQRGRDDIVRRQQQEMIELSTPVVKLWDGVLAVPLIGTLDSERTQVVMETLLQRIVELELVDGHHRHHRGSHGRHAGRSAPAEDGRGGSSDGRRLHHQRDPASDCADDRASRPDPLRGDDKGVDGRRDRRGARPARAAHRTSGAVVAGTGSESRSSRWATCSS